MKRAMAIGLMVLLAATALAQIPRTTIYSRPDLPSEEVLRRLNLKMAWSRYVPMEGRRDGFLTIQVVGKDLLVQSRSGLVARLDAETGVIHWRQRVGRPYLGGHGLAFNARSVYAVNATDLFGLSRATGEQRWRFRLPAGSSAVPLADDRHLYISTATGLFYAYGLPPTDVPVTKAREEEDRVVDTEAPRPTVRWSSQTGLNLEFPPLQTRTRVMVMSPSGEFRVFDKQNKEFSEETREESLAIRARIRVPAGQFGDVAYVGSMDGTLYAFDIEKSRLAWRYTSGTPIVREPMAVDEDVFVRLQRLGLARISRIDVTEPGSKRSIEGGSEIWRNSNADRFVAANRKFVYACDASGRLLVLDRKRGTQLSMLDTRHYRFPVHNTTTDRIYLAAHDGLIVCLHDRDYPRPYNHRLQEEMADPVKQKLAARITAPAKMMTVKEVLTQFEKKPGLKFLVVERAFKERRVENVLALKVKYPAVKNRTVEEVLTAILEQIGATFDVFDETIVIVPGKKDR